MIRKLMLMLFVGFCLVGCASVKPLYHKDGSEAYSANCSGGSWLQCYEVASSKCQKSGYEIHEKLMGRDYGFWGVGETKEMIFACKQKKLDM